MRDCRGDMLSATPRRRLPFGRRRVHCGRQVVCSVGARRDDRDTHAPSPMAPVLTGLYVPPADGFNARSLPRRRPADGPGTTAPVAHIMTTTHDAIIIGTGQAGPSLAKRLADAGHRVAIIERQLVGGTCVNTGCIPTKAMVASAYAAHMARRAADFGVRVEGPVSVGHGAGQGAQGRDLQAEPRRPREDADHHRRLRADSRPRAVSRSARAGGRRDRALGAADLRQRRRPCPGATAGWHRDHAVPHQHQHARAGHAAGASGGRSAAATSGSSSARCSGASAAASPSSKWDAR